MKTNLAPGIVRYDLDWGYQIRGRREALIAAGLAQADWFTDGKETDKYGRIQRTKFLVVNGRKVTARRCTEQHAEVVVNYTDQEIQEQWEVKEPDSAAYDRRLRVEGCIGLAERIAFDIKGKMGKSPELAKSSKLGRVLDDVDMLVRALKDMAA